MGNMGCKYARMLLDNRVTGVELVAVTRVRADRLENLHEIVERNIPIYESADQLYGAVSNSELKVDAVLIVTPHKVHEEQAIKAFSLGLHVLCDKPSGIMCSQARRMNEAAANNKNLVFGMMFNQRMNPLYKKMKEIVESKCYGKIKRVNWVVTDWYRPDAYYDSVTWRGTWAGEGGGLLLNQCPHNLDLLYWICGMPSCVRAFCKEGKYHHIEVEDEVTAYMEYENGATGIFYSTTGEAPGINRLEISLEDALLVCEGGQLRVCELGFKESEYRKTATDQFAKLYGHWVDIKCDEGNTEHQGILQNFINTVAGEGELLVDGREGIKSLMMANAMYLSSWKEATIVIPKSTDEMETFERKFEKAFSKKLHE